MHPKPRITLSPDQRRIVWHLRTVGARSRSALAIELDFNPAALTRLSRELAALDVVEESTQVPAPGRGRPSTPMALSGKAGYAIGATVHPGWLEMAVVDFSGKVVARDIAPFDSPDPRHFIEHVDRRMNRLAVEHRLLHSRFLGMGVAVPGPVLKEHPLRRATVDWLDLWRDIDLEPYFAQRMSVPVWVENEATLATLAEYYDTGLIAHCSSVLALFIGHGVGGGVIHRRDLARGEFKNAGEIGRLFPGGQPRPSGIDLLATLRSDGAQLRSLFELEAHLDRHAAQVDAWAARAARQLGAAVNAGVAWLDPGAIILSGTLPQRVLDALGRGMAVSQWSTGGAALPAPTVHVSRLGGSAAAIGAALLPIHQISA